MVIVLWCTQMEAALEMATVELEEGLECIGEKDILGKHCITILSASGVTATLLSVYANCYNGVHL